jgi:Flp pilus assembly protein TadD
LWIGAALFFGTIAVFAPVASADFLNFDDDLYVTHNVHVLEGLNPADIGWAFRATDASNWHPLTWLSLQLDATFFGLDPRGYHLSSVLVHAANAVLLFLVLARMTGATARSAAVAALFAWHPLRVESVAWIAERKDVLCAFFGMLALSAYARYARRPSASNLAAVAVGHVLSLACKPMLMTLPLLLLILDFWPLRRSASGLGKLILEKAPMAAAAIAVAAVALHAQRAGGSIDSLVNTPLGARLANACVAYVVYLGALAWPAELALFYPHAGGSLPSAAVVAAGLVLACITVAAMATARTRPYVVSGWFWYVLSLLPVVGLVQLGSQALADRYTYLPTVGILWALVWLLDDALRAWRAPALVRLASASVLCVACAAGTRLHLVFWRDSLAAWSHALAVSGGSEVIHAHLADALFHQGRLEEAIGHYRQALEFNPDNPDLHTSLGLAYARLHRADEARAEYERAIAAAQASTQNKIAVARAHNNLGLLIAREGRLSEAVLHFEEALRLHPDYSDAHNNLGVAFRRLGRVADAVAEFQAALRANPLNVQAERNLKDALKKQPRPD